MTVRLLVLASLMAAGSAGQEMTVPLVLSLKITLVPKAIHFAKWKMVLDLNEKISNFHVGASLDLWQQLARFGVILQSVFLPLLF